MNFINNLKKLKTISLYIIILACALSIGCSHDNNSNDSGEYTNIDPAGNYEFAGFALEMKVKDSTVYILNGGVISSGAGLYAIDVSNPSAPVLIEKYTDLESPFGMAIEGNYAYIIDLHNTGTDFIFSLKKINISSVPFTEAVTPLEIPGSPSGVAVRDQYAFIANSELGLQVVDLVNFDDVDAVIPVTESGQPSVITRSGSLALIGGYKLPLVIVDISDPLTPVKLSQLEISYDILEYNIDDVSPHGISASGNYAVLASGAVTLLADIEDPENPQLLMTEQTDGWAEDIAFNGNTALLADGDTGVIVADITDILNFKITGICKTNGYAKQVVTAGNYVYTSVNDRGLMIFDISEI